MYVSIAVTMQFSYAKLDFVQILGYLSFQKSLVCKVKPEVFWNISVCTPLNSYVILQVIFLRFTASYKTAFSSRLCNLNSVYFGMNIAHSQQVNNI